MFQWLGKLENGPGDVTIQAASVGDKIYAFGNVYPCRGDTLLQVCMLDTLTMEWSLVLPNDKDANVPGFRHGHSAVAYGHHVYIWGGKNVDYTNELHCYNTLTSTWRKIITETQPAYRYNHAACLYGNRMYIFGGTCVFSRQNFEDVHYLDLETHQWHEVRTTGEPPENTYLHHCSVVVFNHKMFIFASWIMTCLDLVENRWISVRAECSCISAHTAFVYRNKLYAFVGSRFHDSIRCLNPDTFGWERVHLLGPPPMTTVSYKSVVVDDQLFVFSGRSIYNASGAKTIYDGSTSVLDLEPDLKYLAIQKVIEHKIDLSRLPKSMQRMANYLAIPERKCLREDCGVTYN